MHIEINDTCDGESHRNEGIMKKERIIVLISSILILTALTFTGFFMRSENKDKDNLVVDFGEIEKIGEEDEGAASDTEGLTQTESKQISRDTGKNPVDNQVKEPSGDLLKALEEASKKQTNNASSVTDNDKVTDSEELDPEAEVTKDDENRIDGLTQGDAKATVDTTELTEEIPDSISNAVTTSVLPELTFEADESVTWPFEGAVLIPFSMDATTYFKTLDQYKYSQAAVIAATEGDMVVAPVNAIVLEINETSQTGQTIVLDLGNGYELTIGQLKDIAVSKGEYVTRGQALASISAPTKYFCMEGTNVYVELTKDDVALNPIY